MGYFSQDLTFRELSSPMQITLRYGQPFKKLHHTTSLNLSHFHWQLLIPVMPLWEQSLSHTEGRSRVHLDTVLKSASKDTKQGLKTLHSLGTALWEDRKLLSHSHREKKFSTANLRSVSLNKTDDDQMHALIPGEKWVGKKSGLCSGWELVSKAGRSWLKCNVSSKKGKGKPNCFWNWNSET